MRGHQDRRTEGRRDRSRPGLQDRRTQSRQGLHNKGLQDLHTRDPLVRRMLAHQDLRSKDRLGRRVLGNCRRLAPQQLRVLALELGKVADPFDSRHAPLLILRCELICPSFPGP